MSNQDIHKRQKLNYLLRTWPSGTVITQSWFEKHGISRQLSHFYSRQAWIEKIGQGAFIKAGDRIDWTGGLYTVQNLLQIKMHLGGISVLELSGQTHFVPLGAQKSIYLYPDTHYEKKRLPKWFINAFKDSITITALPRGLFSESLGIESLEQSNFSINVSTKERALMEVVSVVPQLISYSFAYLLFQGQETLRPSMIQMLLESCLSYKIKRLFLHFGKKCSLSWLSYLDMARIDLGHGSRQIAEGGIYDSDYQISIPKLNLLDDENTNIEV